MAIVSFIYLIQIPGLFVQWLPYFSSGYGSYLGYAGSPGYGSWSSLYTGSLGYTISDYYPFSSLYTGPPGYAISGYYPFKGGYSSTIPFMQPWSQTNRTGQSYQYGWMPSSGWGTRYPQYSLSSAYFGGYPFSQGFSPYYSSLNPWPYIEGGTKIPYSTPPVVQGTRITGRVIGPNTIDSNGKIITCYTNSMVQAAYGELDLSPYLGMVVEVYGELQMGTNSQGSLYGARLERVIY